MGSGFPACIVSDDNRIQNPVVVIRCKAFAPSTLLISVGMAVKSNMLASQQACRYLAKYYYLDRRKLAGQLLSSRCIHSADHTDHAINLWPVPAVGLRLLAYSYFLKVHRYLSSIFHLLLAHFCSWHLVR